MKRIPIDINLREYPDGFYPYLKNAKIYDSSCSPEARVIFIDCDGGYYLKAAERGSLKREMEMTSFFAQKGLSCRVIEYCSTDRDYMLTERIKGEDCTFSEYLAQPERLAELLGTLLRQLHSESCVGCPVPDHGARYFETLEKNYKSGVYDPSFTELGLKFSDRDKAYKYVTERKELFSSKVLLHGDYCLPNVLLDKFKFSGFIDVGNGGVGDRHVDLFWGAWTLNYNLKTDKYRDRFFDAYGRELVDEKIIEFVGVAECFG